MKKLMVLLFIFSGCSSFIKKSPQNDLVSIDVAVNHAQMSYLKGCVDAHKKLKAGPSFKSCQEEAKIHRSEILSIINSP